MFDILKNRELRADHSKMADCRPPYGFAREATWLRAVRLLACMITSLVVASQFSGLAYGAPDSTPPTTEFVEFVDSSLSTYWSGVDSTLWYDPTATATNFGVRATAHDSGSPVQHVQFPALGAGWNSPVLHDFRGAPDATGTAVGSGIAGGTGTGLTATYFDNADLTAPVLGRVDPNVDMFWGAGSPDPAVDADTFSVRWEGSIEAPTSGSYAFRANMDDGVRLWVGGSLLIDGWCDLCNGSGMIDLVAGERYPIRVEYYESGGSAGANLFWTTPGGIEQIVPQARLHPVAAGSGNGLRGSYYDTQSFTGTRVDRIDPVVDLFWAAATSPASGIDGDYWSARWEGTLEAPVSGSYTIQTTTDDGVRLWIDGVPIIADWTDETGATPTNTGTITLSAGQRYAIRMEYYQVTGPIEARLSWTPPGRATTIIPQSRLYAPASTDAAPTDATGSGLVATYWDNDDFTGATVSRLDPQVWHDWDIATSPDPDIAPETWASRWEGTVEAPITGTYSFHTWSDDGARLWIDGVQLVSDWALSSPDEHTGTAFLYAGQRYSVRMEHFQGPGPSSAWLRWTPPGGTKSIIPQSQLFPVGQGLSATFWDSLDWGSGTQHRRIDPTVNFTWNDTAYHPTMSGDQDSARWTGTLTAPSSGTYTFAVNHDDDGTVWIDGVMVGGGGPIGTQSGTINLVAGREYAFRAEHSEWTTPAYMEVTWTPPGGVPGPIPSSALSPFAPRNGNGALGRYWDELEMAGSSVRRIDPTIDWNWGTAQPATSIDPEGFSIRWKALVEAPVTGTYTFTGRTDDGVRIRVDGATIASDWIPNSVHDTSGTVGLEAGRRYEVEMDYYEETGDAVAQLLWTPPGGLQGVLPMQRMTSPSYETTYTIGAINPANPGTVQLAARNAAALSSTAPFTVTPDAVFPTGGSIAYADGTQQSSNVSITLTDGTDVGSGVARRELQRRSAPLESGACATWSAWSTIAVDPALAYSDLGLARGACYAWQYVQVDNVGNRQPITTADVVEFDDLTVTAALPAAAQRGRRSASVQLSGTDFRAGATVAFSETGITVLSVTRASSSRLDIVIDVAGNAPTTARDVTVTNPDGTTNTGSDIFTVIAESISVSMSVLGYESTSRDSTVPYDLQFGTLLPGVTREIGPTGSGQQTSGEAVSVVVESDTDWTLQLVASDWIDADGPTLPASILAWRASGSTGSWTAMSTSATTIAGSPAPMAPTSPGSSTISLDHRLTTPANALAGTYAATVSYTVLAAP